MKTWLSAIAVIGVCLFTASQAGAHGKNVGVFGKLLPSANSNQVLPESWPTGYLNFELPQCGPIAYSAHTDHLYLVDSDGNHLVEIDRKGTVLHRTPVGLGPAGGAVSPDGQVLYVTDHLSDSITVIDSNTRQALAVIQQIDPDTRLSVLDEPCGVAFSPTKSEAYVTLGQPNRVAVIDTTNHTIQKMLPIQAEEPRAVRVFSDGAWIYVAALESGNRTEILLTGEGDIDDSDPLLWAWNFLQFILGNFTEEEEIVQIDDTDYPDQDVFVIDSETYEIIGISDVGTLLYGLSTDINGSLWITTTEHLNFKDGPEELDGQPILNRLVQLSPGPGGWADPDRQSFPLDEDVSGQPIPGGAVPYDITTTEGGQLLVTAASSSRLLVVDPLTGLVSHRISVGTLPRGVVAAENYAYVYNQGEMTLSIVSLGDGNSIKPMEETLVAFATDPAPSNIQEGRRLFYDARFLSNGTFACAGCHQNGHTDHLVWDLGDCPRSTMTVRGIAGTEGFHWDGTKATAQQLVIDGVTGDVFRGSIETGEVENMAAFLLNVSFPPSPFRAPTDQLSPPAREGAVITRREVWQDAEHKLVGSRVQFDPAFKELLQEWGGPNVVPREGCALSGCHTAPLWTSPSPSAELIEPVTLRGMWDRNTWVHNGATSKRDTLTATNIYRSFFGHPEPYPGHLTATAASGGFFTTAFRHEVDTTNSQEEIDSVILMPRIEAYQFELSTGLPGILGRSVLYDGSPTPEEAQILTEIINAAAAHKVRMRVEGNLGQNPISWVWLPATNEFQTAQGTTLSHSEAAALLSQASSYTLRVRADLPSDTQDQPLLENIVDGDNPKQLVNAINGKTQTFILTGQNFKQGMWILVDGWRYVQPTVLDSQIAEHIEDPVNAAGSYYIISVLNPDGLQNNEFPIPVLNPNSVNPGQPISFAPSLDPALSPLP
jgi:YVTN family beta-propeller protein